MMAGAGDKRFRPDVLVNLEHEQELFESLLKVDGTHRVLAIKDRGGAGKSVLLESFRDRCRTSKPRFPVSLVALNEFPTGDPFSLVERMVKQFKVLGPRFPTFEERNQERTFPNRARLRQLASGSIQMPHTSFAGARQFAVVAGQNFHNQGDVIFGEELPLTDEQDSELKRQCVEAFLSDLEAHCAQQPLVLLVDVGDSEEFSFSWTKEDGLGAWLLDDLLMRCFFDRVEDPLPLILVIAARDLPDLERNFMAEHIKAIVRLLPRLQPWQRHHLEEYLRKRRFPYTQQQLGALWGLIEQLDATPQLVIQAVETHLSGGVRT